MVNIEVRIISLIIHDYLPNDSQTGKLDEPTIKKMGESRCGLADIKVKINNRQKRFVHQGTNWKPLFRKKGKVGRITPIIN